MLKSGDVVFQDNININNFKDNKVNRLSVVLFTIDIDNVSYACTCPITNSYRNAQKHPEKYYYSNFLLLGPTKLCCVKIDLAALYDIRTIHATGIRLDNNHIDGIFDKINDFKEEKELSQFYNFVRENLDRVKRDRIQEEKRIKKEAKLMRKMKKKGGMLKGL